MLLNGEHRIRDDGERQTCCGDWDPEADGLCKGRCVDHACREASAAFARRDTEERTGYLWLCAETRVTQGDGTKDCRDDMSEDRLS